MGYFNTILPGVIQRNILENPGWYTAYTPYQAEISQGRLEALLNYQTMVCELTAMEIANSSLLDEATAGAEAMIMLYNARSRNQKKEGVLKFFVSELCYPETIDVLVTRAEPLGIQLEIGNHQTLKLDENYFGRFDMGTGGSASVRTSWEKLRNAGAVAKDMLLEAAASEWSVAKNECNADSGYITHQPTGKKLSYGELTRKAASIEIPESVKLKDPNEFRIIGTDLPRTDTPLKVNGTAQYAMDVDLPDMVYAFIERCPYFGGKIKAIDDRDARNVNGVLDIFEIETGIAVVGLSTWAALQGRKNLRITWDKGSNKYPNSGSIYKLFKNRSKKRGAKGRSDGNVKRALKNADTVVDAVYEVPFQAHATMEPMNCVVDYRSDHCQVWAPTQSPKDAQKRVGKMTGFPIDKVKINVTFLGGGFGRLLGRGLLGIGHGGGLLAGTGRQRQADGGGQDYGTRHVKRSLGRRYGYQPSTLLLSRSPGMCRTWRLCGGLQPAQTVPRVLPIQGR